MHFPKPALTIDEQLELLRGRGLLVTDEARARHWLRNVSYYRLSAYCLPFKQGEQFRVGTSFDDVAGLYIFDRKLRLLVLDAIERIEVSLRTAVTYGIAHAHGPFGHTNPKNFAPDFEHAKLMVELAAEERRSRETFALHFRKKYSHETHLPVWMATELLSFGAVSKLYKHMGPKLRAEIALTYGVNEMFLASWIHVLSHVRNICAHHKRLWNREFGIRPKLPTRSVNWPHVVPDNGRLYAVLVILQHMLRVVSPRGQWSRRLFLLFDQHPAIPLAAMGAPLDWRTRVLWRPTEPSLTW